MHKIIMSAVILLFFSTGVMARSAVQECSPGYNLRSPLLTVVQEDLGRLGLDAEAVQTLAGKAQELRSREEALVEEYGRLENELAEYLSGSEAAREEADQKNLRLAQIIEELNTLRVEGVFELSGFLTGRQIRKFRKLPRACPFTRNSPRLPLPPAVRAFGGRIRGLNEDENRYLADFKRRENYFIAEQLDLKLELDRMLARRNLPKEEIQAALARLASSVRQRNINALDWFYYLENRFKGAVKK